MASQKAIIANFIKTLSSFTKRPPSPDHSCCQSEIYPDVATGDSARKEYDWSHKIYTPSPKGTQFAQSIFLNTDGLNQSENVLMEEFLKPAGTNQGNFWIAGEHFGQTFTLF